MKALLRKDFYVTRTRSWIFLVLILSFGFIPGFEFVGFFYLLAIAMNLSHSAAADDERCGWDIFAAMLPLHPREIVLSRYLYTFLMVFGAGGLAVTIPCVWITIAGGNADLSRKILFLTLVLLINAAFLPVIYRLGPQKSLTVLLAATIAVVFAATGLVRDDGTGLPARAMGNLMRRVQSVPALRMGLLSAAAVAAANLVSFQLSVRFYCRRRNGLYD